MDDAYHREFFNEWVAVVGRGWRIHRIVIPTLALAGVGGCIAALTFGTRSLLSTSCAALLIAAVESWRQARHRAAWYRACAALPWYGRDMRIVVHSGLLVQRNEYEGDPRFKTTGEILVTPNGYLVRYKMSEPIANSGTKISPTDASVYIPHRAITPSMPQEAFAALIGARRSR